MKNETTENIVSMFSLSETKPKLQKYIISREQYLDFFEKQFEEDKVLCVNGAEGVGVTTALVLFANRHREECASYFNNGWSRHLLNPHTIVQSLLQQLSHYTHSNLDPQETETSLASHLYKLSRTIKNKNKYLYFVFDGFNNVPTEYVDTIKTVLSPLFSLENARFLFSGSNESISQILPSTITAKQSNEILRFQRNDLEGYLEQIHPGLDTDDIDTIFKLSNKGLARDLAILTEKLQECGIEKIRDLYSSMVDDFYEEDYVWVEQQDDRDLYLFLSLLAFSERPLNRKLIMCTLKLSEEVTNQLIMTCDKYIEEENELITLKSDNYRKYLRNRLCCYKNDIELLLIDFIEKKGKTNEQFAYLPALYKHVKDNKTLVSYLTSEKVQQYLENEKSQAALNEQCEYGYNACYDFESQPAAYFRFAINRSMSREIEKNELSDAEIEALIAIGDDEKAFTLTQNVFLLEERLKCLLIIAQAGKHLSEAMYEEIDVQINALTDAIDFVHIPDKALELAKLMLPVKMEKALDIIDQVAKVTKDKQQIDRLYTAISISYNDEGRNNAGNDTKADIANTKIVDNSLRKMASVMKSIMADSTAEQVVTKMKELPTASSQLYFLRFWIPDHKDSNDVGDVVEYAVKLVIDMSSTSVPKVSFLRQFCIPLPNMKESQIKKIINMLDAVVANINYPTVEYIKLQILVISAMVKHDKLKAKDRLQNLYLEILDLNDLALQAHCKSLLLKDYNLLGDTKDVEEWLSTKYSLQVEITKDVSDLLLNSAYHMKIVEGPIKALVCEYPTFVYEVIEKMNTKERRDRAYLLAASEYIRQTDIKKINWDYFKKLFYRVNYDKTDLYKPLILLVHKMVEVNNDEDQNLLKTIKKIYCLFKGIEQAEVQCFIYSSMYVWLCQNYEDEEFKCLVKNDLEKAWDSINIPWLKVKTGYEIAKVLSKISMKNEAREYIRKTMEIRKNQLLSSLSCVTAYDECQDLYVHSLGILIRSGLCTEDDIKQFENLLNYDDSEGEAIILWARVALEYYGVKNIDKFNEIITRFVSKQLDKFSPYYQKRILYHISPAIFLNSKSLLYTRLKDYDTCFYNVCLENIARYILTKYPYSEYTSSNDIESQAPLDHQDYELLLDLMEHTKDEGFLLSYTDIISKNIKRNIGNKLSRELQHVLFDQLEDIVNRRLPMNDGIQHNGYKIACLAIINSCSITRTIDSKKLKEEIEKINNIADQAFLYAHIAGYLTKSSEKSDFLEQAVKKTELITDMFDKMNRYSYCLQESFMTVQAKAQSIATKVMASLKSDMNGTYSDYQRMIDMVRDHDEELAEDMLEMVDDDPARVQYKKRLKQQMASSKKIDAARTDLMHVSRLTNDEQMLFFERQMEYLIKKKNIIRDIKSTHPIITKIYENPITDTQNAVLFFMENLYERNQTNHKFNSLLREIHLAIVDNLKLVLAIASGTKEKLDRVNRILNEHTDKNNAMIQVGEANKGVNKLLNWYKDHPFDSIMIIDPFFHAEDLFIIKSMMDINNGLKCSILTNNNKSESIDVLFQTGWNMISAELPGRIEIKTCCYEEQPQNTPWHDRWWLLYDTNKDEYKGLRMASPSTLGARITEISEMDNESIDSAMKIFNRFFVNMAPKNNELKLKYDETKLR